jgi:hypothetical protein
MPKLGLGMSLVRTRLRIPIAVSVVNPNFDDLSGLQDHGGGWYGGVPFGWNSQKTDDNTYSVKSTNGVFYANLQALSQVGQFYVDDFIANNGALSGRTTASGFGAWATSDNSFQVDNGQITINSNTPVDYHAASFALPALGATDILSLSITVRPSGANFMGFGFNPNPATATTPTQFLTHIGYGWVYFEGLGSANPNIQIFKGPSTGGAVYAAPLTHPTLNFDPSLATTFEFTYSASAKTLSLLASNGSNSSTLLNNLDVSSIPLSAFQNFSLQFQGQEFGTSSNPAYVDSLSVSNNGFKTFYQNLGVVPFSAIGTLNCKACMLGGGSSQLGFGFYNSTSGALIANGGAVITASESAPQTVSFSGSGVDGTPIRLAFWSTGTAIGIRDISVTLD